MKSLIRKITILFSVVFLLSLSACVEVEYIDCNDVRVEIINNTSYFVCYSLDPADTYCYPDNFIAPGGTLIVSYGAVHSRTDMPEFMPFYYIYGGEGEADYAMDIPIDDCYPRVYID